MLDEYDSLCWKFDGHAGKHYLRLREESGLGKLAWGVRCTEVEQVAS